MEQIRLGLKNNIDVNVYLLTEFTSEQMEQIRYGLQKNINVGIYATPKFTWR